MECDDSAVCLLYGRVALWTWFRYILLLRILQCTAGLSGTMTSWNVLNSSVVFGFANLHRGELHCPRQHWYCGALHSNLRIHGFVLHFSLLCEYCVGTALAETTQAEGCNFPYETRGMLDWRWYFWSFFLACIASRTPSLSTPPWGGFWLFPFTASRLRLTDMVTTLSMEVWRADLRERCLTS